MKQFSRDNVKNVYVSRNAHKQIKELLNLNLVLKPVVKEGSCEGCFLRYTTDYSVCHVLDCNGKNHVFFFKGYKQ